MRWAALALLLLCAGVAAPAAAARKGSRTAAGGAGDGDGYIDDIALSDINILLPCSASTAVSYTLYAHNGCFRWESQKPEVVAVEAEYSADGACSTSAVVRPLCSHAHRSSSFVTAEDVVTGRRLRCEVYVDRIERIDILTTNRMMYRDDVEQLEIQAFDEDGNIFSTLEGLEFQWWIFPYSTSGQRSATASTPASSASLSSSASVKFQAFRDSTKEVSPTLLEMEQQGKGSWAVLIQGIETGRANVTARFLEDDDVNITTKVISVREPLTLVPAHRLYVAAGSTIQYGLQTLTGDGHARDIAMPNRLYRWSASNSSVAEVNERGLVHVLAVGHTDVRVHVENLEEHYVSADVIAVPPSHITLKIVPFSSVGDSASVRSLASSANYYLISREKYVVTVEVYDEESHKISATENLEFSIELSSEYFGKIDSTRNNGQHTVQTLREGTTIVSAALTAIHNKKTGKRTPLHGISVRSDVVVSAPVRVTPSPTVLLPWDEHVAHRFTLRAAGGSGDYTWKSSDASVVSVSAHGTLTTHARGRSTIKATDPKNPANMDHIEVVTAEVRALDLVPRVLEVEVGDAGGLALPLAAYSSAEATAGTLFNNCSAMPVRWALSDADVLAFAEPPPGERAPAGSCAMRRVVALREGQCRVTAEYGGLTAHTTIFAFRPLAVLEPATKLLTPGASSLFVYSGGPNPWFYEPTAYFADLPAHDAAALRVTRVRLPDAARHRAGLLEARDDDEASLATYAFSVTCLRHHEQTLTLTVGNRATSSNARPLQSSTTARVVCKDPTSLLLYPLQPAVPAGAPELECADGSWTFPSPGAVEDGSAIPAKFRVRCHQSLPFHVAVLDESGAPFTNFSSLALDWMTTNSTIAAWDLASVAALPAPTGSDGGWSGAQKVLALGPHEGVVQVQVRVVGYDRDVLRRARISTDAISSLEATVPTLKKSVRLQLLANVELVPSGHITLFHARDNALQLSARGGSGHAVFTLDAAGVVAMTAADGAEQLGNSTLRFAGTAEDGAAVTLHPRGDGWALVTVRDPCLVGSEAISAHVRVSGISQLRISTPDLLLRGESAELWLEAYDSDGNLFSSEQYKHMQLSVQFDTSYVAVSEQPAAAHAGMLGDVNAARLSHRKLYFVEGAAIGIARISVQARDGAGVAVTSNTVTVQVFDAFEITPRELTLLPGASSQLQWRGGPSEAEVSFALLDDDDSSAVTAEGVVSALRVGRNSVRAVASAVDSVTGQRKVFGSCITAVEVVLLDALRVFVPSRTLLAGERMYARVVGSRGETPFAFGGREVRFHWESSNGEVVRMHPVYEADEEAALSVNGEGAFTAHIEGSSPGEARVHVSVVSAPDSFQMGGMSASVLVRVAERFELLTPPSLLLSTGAVYEVRTNHDHAHSVHYDVVCPSAVERCDCVRVDPDGSGAVSASFHSGVAFLSLTHAGEGGTQSLVVMVEVRPVYSLHLLAPDEAQIAGFSAVHHTMPVGSAMVFHIAVRDRVGREFDAVDFSSMEQLEALVDHRDVVSVSLNERARQLTVRALKPGVATLRVSAGATDALQEYAKIRVGNAISPSSPVVSVGGVVSFGISHVSRQNAGSWHSDDPAVLTVERQSGTATAHRAGTCTVRHEANGIVTFTDVTVVEVSAVELDMQRVPALSNAVSGAAALSGIPAEYFAPVRFLGSLRGPSGATDVSLFDTADVQHHIEYECSLEERAWGTAVRDVDPASGERGCLLSLYAPELVRHRSEPIPDALTVSVRASRGNARATERVPYYPAFVIVGEMGETLHAHLSIAQPAVEFEIRHGSNVPTVHSTDSSLVTVTPLSRGAADGTTRYQIAVSQRRRGFKNAQVEVWAQATKQREILLVDFSVSEPSTSVVFPSQASTGAGHVGSTPVNGVATSRSAPSAARPDGGRGAGFWGSMSPLVILIVIALVCALVALVSSGGVVQPSFFSSAAAGPATPTGPPRPALDRTAMTERRAQQPAASPFTTARTRTTPGTQPRPTPYRVFG